MSEQRRNTFGDIYVISCPPLSSSSAALFSPSASDFAAALLESVAFAAVPAILKNYI